MTEYKPSTYGDRIAESYDTLHPSATPAAIDVLAELAAGGPVLELGVGTGRFALPLVQRGLTVHGIDASQAMIAKLRAKEMGDRVSVTIGDFSNFRLDHTYSLVFVAFNTFFALGSQDAQVECCKAVARHLRPGGTFLVEAFVPDLSRFDRNQRMSVRSIDSDNLYIEASTHDAVHQRVESHIVQMSNGGIALFPVQLRYAWPSELDLMAKLAGLALFRRWSNWHMQPFDASSQFHISVYRQADT